ncbi:hypothetical protein [Paenibacillus sp. MER TA 81-3]|uniref:hypothetical protein n=1 Tax=Paenibacillus sp. MER TA 81-3 TaxID=2939573 RepID=UPI002041B03B|nr:hypothetical protein [Paenibacillus sp. MER TA 81-3]
MALNQRVFIRRWLRTAYVLPLVMPVASFVLVWQTLFDWNGAKKYEGGLYSMPIGVSLSMMQANTLVRSDDKVMRIVADKAKMYYAGQKSLDEVVQFIQSRVITYLNE